MLAKRSEKPLGGNAIDGIDLELNNFQLAHQLLAEEDYYDSIDDRGGGGGGGRKFPRDRSTTLFQELDELLRFDHPKVRAECAGMLARIVPRIDQADLDLCVGHVLPSLVENLGHDDRDVRESAAHALVVYLKHASEIDAPVRAVLARAFGHRDPAVRARILNYLHLIYATDGNENEGGCLDAVFRCLVSQMSQGGDHEKYASTALRNMRDKVGEQRMQKFSTVRSTSNEPHSRKVDFTEETNPRQRNRAASRASLRFFVSTDLMYRLTDLSDYNGRIAAADELKNALRDLQDVEQLIDGLPQFLPLLASLLNDNNFKVTLTALDIYGVLIDKLNWRCESHLRWIVGDLAVHLGENKVVVRAKASRVLASLVGVCGAAPVVTALLDVLREPPSNKRDGSALNPKAREEIVNEVIIALSKFPNYEFDLYDVCSKVAPSLLDQKRRVRHAVLECLAVLAHAMGPSKLATVAAAIDAAAEPHHDTEGALAAVLARLARRQLPRVDQDGRVQYSLRIDASAVQTSSQPHFGRNRGPGLSEGADVDWIMAGSGSLYDSAGSRIVRSQPASFPSSPASPRRIVSPSNAKNSLPWNDNKPARPRMKERSTFNNDGGDGDGHTAQPSSRLSSSWPNKGPTSNSSRSSGESSNATSAMGPPWTASEHSTTSSSLDRFSNTGSSYRILYSGSQTSHSDKAASRPLDKVAAMLGPNLLPSKLRPIADSHTYHRGRTGTSSSISTTVVPLSASTHSGELHSSTLSGPPGSLPALPSRRNLLGPLADSPPVPTRPKLVRSSSGGRRRRSTISRTESGGQSTSPAQQSHSEDRRRDHSSGRVVSSPDSRDVSPMMTVRSRSDSRLTLNGTHAVMSEGPRKQQQQQQHLMDGERGLSGSDYFEDGNDASVDNYGARASVDSGVESLLRPNSSSPAIVKVLENPASLDLSNKSSTDEQNVAPQEVDQEEDNASWEFRDENAGDGVDGNSGGGDVGSVVTEAQSVMSSAAESTLSSMDATTSDGKAVEPLSVVAYHDNRIEPFSHTSGTPSTSTSDRNCLPRTSLNRTVHQTYTAPATERCQQPHRFVHCSSPIVKQPPNGIKNGFNVVGKGILPSSKVNGITAVTSPDSLRNSSQRPYDDNGDVDDEFLPSIQGRSVGSAENALEDEDPHAMSLSRTTFNKMMHRKMELQQEADRRKEAEKRVEPRDVLHGSSSWFDGDDVGGGRNVVASRNDNNNDGIEVNRQNATPVSKPTGLQSKSPKSKPPVTRRKLKGTSSAQQLMSSSGNLSGGLSTPIEVALVQAGSEDALRTAYEKLASDEWQSKCHGLRIMDALAKNSPDIIATDVHNINVALVNEVKNLRSTVARTAIQCLAQLFYTVKKHMESDLEMICRALLHKSGESNVFIKQDVEKALENMVEAVSPQKACIALIVTGATHKNAAVRKITAQFVCTLCERLGASRVLSGQKDVTERILPTAANFMMDGSPLTRYYGRKIFFMLMSNPEFERSLKQHLQSTTLRNIHDILENLRVKGLGNMPNESASSKQLKGSLK